MRWVAARAAQGATAALVLPLTLTMISEAFPAESRGRAIGVWGGVLGLGGVLGPILGAGLVQAFGWSWIFWMNVPIALALIPAGLQFVTETFGARQPLDVPGLGLESVGFLAICWGLVQATNHSIGSAAVVAPVFGGAVLVGCFVAGNARPVTRCCRSQSSATPGSKSANAVSFCIYGSLTGSVFLMSQYFQIAQHHDPVAAAVDSSRGRCRLPSASLAGFARREVRQSTVHGRAGIRPSKPSRAGSGSRRRPREYSVHRTVCAPRRERHRHRSRLSAMRRASCCVGTARADGYRGPGRTHRRSASR